MKKLKNNINALAIGLAGLLGSLSVAAQDLSPDRVPSVVVNEFQKQFPKATDVDWEMDEGAYQVEFEIDRLDHEVWFDQAGRILRHKEEISTRSVPEAVKSAIRDRYRGYRIVEADKLTRGDNSVYKLEIKRLWKDMDVVVDEKGNEVRGFIWN